MFCEFLIVLWLGQAIPCPGWHEAHQFCQAQVQPRACLMPSTVAYLPENQILTISGPNDIASFDLSRIQTAGRIRIRWVEHGRTAEIGPAAVRYLT